MDRHIPCPQEAKMSTKWGYVWGAMGSKGSNLPTCLGKSGAASRKTVCDLKLEGDWWLIAGQTARRGEMHINIEA